MSSCCYTQQPSQSFSIIFIFFQEFERKLEEEKIRAIEAAMKEKEAEFKRQQEALRLQEEKLRKQKEWFEC